MMRDEVSIKRGGAATNLFKKGKVKVQVSRNYLTLKNLLYKNPFLTLAHERDATITMFHSLRLILLHRLESEYIIEQYIPKKSSYRQPRIHGANLRHTSNNPDKF